jgi:hypothetical protein
VSCIAYMMIGRRWYSLPIDLVALGAIASLAAIFVFGARLIPAFVTNTNILLLVDLVVFVGFSTFAVLHFGLLSSASDAVEPVALDRAV